MKYISLPECKDDHLYLIKARNAGLGLFVPETKAFVMSRDKFGSNFLFSEYHWDTGAPYGTVKPYKDLGASAVRHDADPEGLLDYLNEQAVRYEAHRELTRRYIDEAIEEGFSPLVFLRHSDRDADDIRYCQRAIREHFGDKLPRRAEQWLGEIEEIGKATPDVGR